MESARRSLAEKVGVRPSEHWLTDCWAALSLERNPPHADDVLEQILHHDLRDVVRTFDRNDGASDDASLPSVQLRQALRQSQQATHQFKAELSANFQLLVQIEEVLDISANAMKRLEYGPTNSNTDPAPVGNSGKRCLKIAYSDGYTATGEPFYDENHPSELLVAMEVQPIPELSVFSRAGLKILLKGPLTLRRGVCLLHAGNTTIIGGSVAALVEMQMSALQQAKRLAGVGVDPTVRALIGTQPLETEEENNDEGEHESGDVPAAPPAPPPGPRATVPPPQPDVANHQRPILPPVVATHRPAPPVRDASASVNPYDASARNVAPPRDTRESHTPPNRPPNSSNPYVANRTLTSQSMSPPYPRSNTNPYSSNRSNRSDSMSPPNPRPAVSHGMSQGSSSSSTTTTTTTTTTTAASHSQPVRNPYGSTNNVSRPRPPANPYARSQVNSQSTAPVARPPPPVLQPVVLPDSPDAVMILDDDEVSKVADDSTESMQVETSEIQTNSSDSAIPFSELLVSVRNLVLSTPEAYRQGVREKEWIAELRLSGPRVDFNVVSKKTAGSKKKEYEYRLVFKFGGGEDSSQLVTCQLDSPFVEKFLQYTPADLRKLRKTQANEANNISKEGGNRIQKHIKVPRKYRVTLAEVPDEYFQKEPRSLDGDQPVLYLREL